jgi:hypothetical protein
LKIARIALRATENATRTSRHVTTTESLSPAMTALATKPNASKYTPATLPMKSTAGLIAFMMVPKVAEINLPTPLKTKPTIFPKILRAGAICAEMISASRTSGPRNLPTIGISLTTVLPQLVKARMIIAITGANLTRTGPSTPAIAPTIGVITLAMVPSMLRDWEMISPMTVPTPARRGARALNSPSNFGPFSANASPIFWSTGASADWMTLTTLTMTGTTLPNTSMYAPAIEGSNRPLMSMKPLPSPENSRPLTAMPSSAHLAIAFLVEASSVKARRRSVSRARVFMRLSPAGVAAPKTFLSVPPRALMIRQRKPALLDARFIMSSIRWANPGAELQALNALATSTILLASRAPAGSRA